jgi:sugar phosphate isomerase/epimerase
MKRRQFLRAMHTLGAASCASTCASTLLMPSWVQAINADNVHRKQIGIQLYTLRNEIKEDVRATIKAVADAGYFQVEAYGFPNCDAIIDASNEFGLRLNSSHFNSDPLVQGKPKSDATLETILEKANKVGLTHLEIPYLGSELRKSLDDYKRLCERCNAAAEKSKQYGIQLAYHNHAFEFKPLGENSRCGYDVMMEEFSSDMKFEVDVFWVAVANRDPVELIHRLDSRVTQLHLKDLSATTKVPSYEGVSPEAFEEIGDGIIDMNPIMQAALQAGVEHCHIEQDQSPDALASIRKSIGHLKQM